MSIIKRSTFTEIITILFVILFLYTGISKLMDYLVFKEQIATSPLLTPLAPIIAAILPWAEFAVVLVLVIPRWRLKGLYASLALMILFTAYIIAVLSFNKHIPCSCGGVIALLSWNQHIVFNSVFIALGLTGVILENREKKEYKRTIASLVKYGAAKQGASI